MIFSSPYQIEIPDVDALTYLFGTFLLARFVALYCGPTDFSNRNTGYQ